MASTVGVEAKSGLGSRLSNKTLFFFIMKLWAILVKTCEVKTCEVKTGEVKTCEVKTCEVKTCEVKTEFQ